MITLGLLIEYDTILKTIRRMTHEIIEKNEELSNIVLIGILTKGYPIAKMIQDNIFKYEGVLVETFSLDISPYRDDEHKKNVYNQPIDVTNKVCVVIDDVLYTGRTIRAAMDALIDMGRPQKIQLAVLIDRGHRELPIRPDYIGKNIPTSNEEIVKVRLEEPNQGVFIEKKEKFI